MTKLADLKRELLKDPEVRREYDALEDEFALIHALLAARARAGLTQAEVAERMGTSQAAVARMEGGGVAPSMATLQRYAKATGSRLRVALEGVTA